ncbi:phosphatase PAP2 family protein [Rhizobium sp. 2MFCol3.1]|uniref:phosphatase PAP2 family protein n=1 Tax=Rhizobium sp. 2MFCol3.1 TaxID=1246459 RepID=UPI00055B2ACF|nr:phosphatase PAP2 family protein [Rhizobium sp. 2MFCol3.1]
MAIRETSYSAADIFKLLLITWFALLAVFNLFPQIDQEVSAHFFTMEACAPGAALQEICGHFPYREDFWLQILRTLLLRLPYVVAFVLFWKFIDCYSQFGATFDGERARKLKLALGSLIVGPIVLVNFILKDHWGRPRPFSTTDFGGALDFVPAGSTAGKCLSNCSFVSGEAAGAGWLLCLLFIMPRASRRALFLPLATISLLAPALRLAFGAHYLSDVILGWLSSFVVFAGILALTDSPQREKKLKIE